MPTEKEFEAIMAVAIKAMTRVDDDITRQQGKVVLEWANKVLDQKAKARVVAREYKRNHKKGQ